MGKTLSKMDQAGLDQDLQNQIAVSLCNTLGVSEEEVQLYPSSFTIVQGLSVGMVKVQGARNILVMALDASIDTLLPAFSGDRISDALLLCPLHHENRLVLNQLLPATLPTAFGRQIPTFGVGDRLGLASPAHIAILSHSKAKPILAQQSKRELDLTGRTYENVLDDVSFAVFQEGYRGGFGADGDHLKQKSHIKEALDCGYTMITLDCSEKIGRGVEQMSPKERQELYDKVALPDRNYFEAQYLGRAFEIGNAQYHFAKEDLMQCILVYHNAIEFIEEVSVDLIQNCGRPIDFELSIDETESVTTALAHLFVASELQQRQVEITSLAPRFVGEFQKGIDYLGNLEELRLQLQQHTAIAEHFGYKLSIHSGSDKFSAFPMIGETTKGFLHIKTSGTNWLEAVATIAIYHPALYRHMHRKALQYFEEAKAFYYVSADLDQIAPLDQTPDEGLISYLDQVDSRQLLHITYGFQLQDVALKKEIYAALSLHEAEYRQRLIDHIGRHLELLSLLEGDNHE